MAGTEECERHAEVFRVGKLLQMICQRFCKDSKTSLWDNKERSEMELGRKAVESIWGVEGEVYNRASLGYARPR